MKASRSNWRTLVPPSSLLVQDGEEQRRQQRDRGMSEVDGAHLAARDVERQPLLDRRQQRLERRLQIARSHPRVVDSLGQPDDVRADSSHVLQAEGRSMEHLVDRERKRVLSGGDERAVARRLATLPDEVGLNDAIAIAEVVAQRRHADAGGAGHLAEARPRVRDVGQPRIEALQQRDALLVIVAVAAAGRACHGVERSLPLPPRLHQPAPHAAAGVGPGVNNKVVHMIH
jgi:hypothetical protein